MAFSPQDMWQQVFPALSLPQGVQPGGDAYAASLPDGRQIVLPLRVLPGGNDRAVASLILNQAGFAVLDAVADALVAALPCRPDSVIGVPTLGLPLAEAVARRLGHRRMVPLSTSVKFWYDPALSEPLRSITSPDQAKRIYIDPRMLPLLAGQRVLLVDDVLSSGTSIAAVLRLLARVGVAPVAIAAAMLQGEAWRGKVAEHAPDCPVLAVIATPILRRTAVGWQAEG